MKDKKYKYLKSFGKMREKEVRELYEAYASIYEGTDADMYVDKKTGKPHTWESRRKALEDKKNKIKTEEVEAWVNALVEEGYDLSEYTWEDMYEMYLDEARTDPRGRPASGPMSVYGGRGTPSPDPEGDDNVSRMDRAQRRVKRTQPRAKGMAADALFTKYSARQKGAGGEEGPGPNAPRRGGRSGRGANTDRGSGNAAKRRMGEDFDLFDYILEHLVAEGYADTEEAALKIMANMSEDWRQSIVEAGGAIRADVPQPGQRTVRMTATGKEPAGDRFVRQAGETIGRFLGSRGVQKIEPAPPQRKPLGSTTKPGPSNNFGRGF